MNDFLFKRANYTMPNEANRFANALQALGIGNGARIILLLPNIPQMVVGYFGSLKAGATVVLIPPMSEPEDLIRQVQHADASVLVTLSTWSGLVKQIQAEAGVPHVVMTDPADDTSPTMVQTADGKLLTAFVRDGRLWSRASADGGAMWAAETQIDGCCRYNPSLARGANGTLWLAYDRDSDIWYRTDGGLYPWKAAGCRSRAARSPGDQRR